MSRRDDEGEAAIIVLDELSPLPKYQQIVEQVKAHVAAGRLRPGAALPSVRQLASDLGINVNTVIAAYRVLEAEEVVVVRHGSRVTVHPRLASAVTPQPEAIARVRATLERARTEGLLAGMSLDALRTLALEVLGEHGNTR